MNTLRPYSLVILVHPQASPKERDEAESLVRSWVEERKGTVQHVSHEPKRRLSYPMSHAHQATYTTMRFAMAPEPFAELEEKLHRQKKVLRTFLRQVSPRAEGKTLKDAPLRPGAAEKVLAAPKKEKASLEKLDQKIEEILGEEVL